MQAGCDQGLDLTIAGDDGLAERGKLPDNIVYFARVLRAAGLNVGPSTTLDAVRVLEALPLVDLGNREVFYWALHGVFVKKQADDAVFQEAFRLFWRRRELAEKMMAMLSPSAAGQKAEKQAGQQRVHQALFQDAGHPRAPEQQIMELDARLSFSARDVLQSKDFEQMTAEELQSAMASVRRLADIFPRLATRRSCPSHRPGLIDRRGTLRQMMRQGDLLQPAYRALQKRVPPIVALCDISGSMSTYSRVFLHFLHAVSALHRPVHSFLFGTRLTNITRDLARRDPDAALDEVTRSVRDWSGGTRIAASLHRFNKDWSRRVLGQGAIVLLLTDGLERDEDGDLAREMDRLHRSCRRLIWLNPLLRYDGFEARASGIRTMLPHVDAFRPVHSLASVADLCTALVDNADTPFRPQQWLQAGKGE